MTPEERTWIGRAQRFARDCERYFRLQLFEADTNDERDLSSVGLRHSVGLKKAFERLLAKQ